MFIFVFWSVINLGGNNPTLVVFRRVLVNGRARLQWVAGGFKPATVILIKTVGLSVLHAADYATLTLNTGINVSMFVIMFYDCND